MISRALAAATAVLTCVALAAPAARAADAVVPADGATVGSRPQFVFDFADGAAAVELSKAPDVKTAGDDAGAFVENAASDFMLVEGGVPQAWEGERLDAGRYFWHVRAHDYALPDVPEVWSPTRTLTVRDEPIVFEGWTATAHRGRTIGGCARTLVQGSIVWSDNASSPTARYSIRVSAGRRAIKRLTGTFEAFDHRFSAVVCTRARAVRVTAALRDAGGHVTVGRAKQLTVRRA